MKHKITNSRQQAIRMMTDAEKRKGISPFDCKAWISHKNAIRKKESKKMELAQKRRDLKSKIAKEKGVNVRRVVLNKDNSYSIK